MDRDSNPNQLVSEILTQWRKGGAPDAARCLTLYPAIRDQKSLALELAYEEYCLREESGDSVNVQRFCGRFPSIRHSLRRQIEVHHFFESNPEILRSATHAQWPSPGETFLGFSILEELGRGGLARVYLCSQPSVGNRQVVIKIAHQGAYEADTLGRLKHSNIVPVYSVVEDQDSGMSGICMPFCGRSTLCDVLDLAFGEAKPPARARVILQAAVQRRDDQDRYDRVDTPDRRLNLASYVNGVLHLGVQLADALRHAHEQGVLHGDLKPSNILITPSGRPMLLDFNLSHNQHDPTAMTGGTLPYMAPEQIRSTILKTQTDGEEVDPRCDIYSLGTILHELLSGQLPYGPVVEPVATSALARNHLAAQRRGPQSLSKRSPAIDPSLASFIDQCLAFDRASRPGSMDIVRDRLSHHARTTRRAVRWSRVNRRAVLTSAAGFALAGAWGVPRLMQKQYIQREYDRGMALFRDRQFDAAEVHMANVVQADPNWADARRRLGVLREYKDGMDVYHEGQFEMAAGNFRSALEADPGFAEANYQLGRSYIRRGDLARRHQPDRADDHFARGQELFQKLTGIRSEGRDYACLGYCYHRRGKDQSASNAMEFYRRALQSGYRSVGLYNNLGYGCFRLADYDQAVANLEEALSMNPVSAVVNYNLAVVDERRADEHHVKNEPYVPEKGIRAIEDAIQRSPQQRVYYSVSARLLAFAALHPQCAQRDDYERECLDHLGKAQSMGVSRSEVEHDPALKQVRTRYPEAFQEILNTPGSTVTRPPIDEHLIDPIEES